MEPIHKVRVNTTPVPDTCSLLHDVLVYYIPTYPFLAVGCVGILSSTYVECIVDMILE
jgi:hypothetical protein